MDFYADYCERWVSYVMVATALQAAGLMAIEDSAEMLVCDTSRSTIALLLAYYR